MNDRIKLAEAMGWKLYEKVQKSTGKVIIHTRSKAPMHGSGDYVWTEVPADKYPDSTLFTPTFDPFTDANDDYAVLEWMRKQDEEMFTSFAFRCNIHWMDDWCLYKIGDYARAALKVMT